MSILTQRLDTVTAFEAAQKQLYGHLIGGAAIIIAVLICPKDTGIDLVRLVLAGLFFTGLMTIVWAAAEPLETYLRARMELVLEDFGPDSRSIASDAIDSLCRYLNRFVWLLIVITWLLFLRVLAAWPIGAPLLSVIGVIRLAFWLSICALPVQLFVSTNRLAEIFSIWRVYRQQVQRSGFRPNTVASARQRAALFAGPAVTVLGPYKFQAGATEWSWGDLQKNAIVFGQTGSGKTVTILNAFLDGLFSSADGRNGTEAASALILDPKGDYRIKIRTLCQRLRRMDDLCVLDPNSPEQSVHWNPFDSPDDALEISERFAGVLQLLGMKSTQDSIWIDTAKAFIRHAVALLRATELAESPPSFVGINELATQMLRLEARLFILYSKSLLAAVGHGGMHVEELVGDIKPAVVLAELPDQAPGAAAIRAYFRGWEGKRVDARLAVAKEVREMAVPLRLRPAVPLTHGSEALLAAEYLSNSWIPMPEKTRGSVQVQLNAMVDQFLTEPYRTLFSGKSTLQLADVLAQGKIFYVLMPAADRAAMSQIVNTLIKAEFYRQVLLQPRKTRPSLFLCDEFQTFFTSDERRGDGAFFERSRESFHANLVATQNMSSLLRMVEKPEIADNFLGNCAVKIFLRNTEGKTLEYASKHIFGEFQGYVATVGRSIGATGGKGGFGEGASISVSAQTMPRVPPERIAKLAIPDRENGTNYAEAIIHLGSRSQVAIERLRFKVHPLD